MFSLIAAVGKNRELGYRGELCFHLKGDMRFFRETTTGHPVVMGRKTWESLPAKLKNRQNIVISRQAKLEQAPDLVTTDAKEFIKAHRGDAEEYFVIGGAAIYGIFLPYAEKIYLTEVAAGAKADKFFPEFDRELYQKNLITEAEENGLAYTISEYVKK